MAAKAWLVPCFAGAALAAAGSAGARVLPADNGPTFLTLEDFAEGLIQNVVRIDSKDGEHGFGLIVGTDERYIFIATAKHVIFAGEQPPKRNSITIKPCAAGAKDMELKGELLAWHGNLDDIAFVRAPLPRNFKLDVRALIAERGEKLRDETVAIGHENRCQLHARDGRISSPRDANNNLSVELPTAVGGDSGGPVVTARGVIGIVRSAGDTRLHLQSIDYVRQVAGTRIPWQLVDARNIPPTSPDAAQQELTQTLNDYLWGLRNVHELLLLPRVDQTLFSQYGAAYAKAIEHYFTIKEKYDGTLNEFWGSEVLEEWQRIRQDLWNIHQPIRGLNAKRMDIWEKGVTPEPERTQLVALEPAIQRLQDSIMQFTARLATRRKKNENTETAIDSPR